MKESKAKFNRLTANSAAIGSLVCSDISGVDLVHDVGGGTGDFATTFTFTGSMFAKNKTEGDTRFTVINDSGVAISGSTHSNRSVALTNTSANGAQITTSGSDTDKRFSVFDQDGLIISNGQTTASGGVPSSIRLGNDSGTDKCHIDVVGEINATTMETDIMTTDQVTISNFVDSATSSGTVMTPLTLRTRLLHWTDGNMGEYRAMNRKFVTDTGQAQTSLLPMFTVRKPQVSSGVEYVFMHWYLYCGKHDNSCSYHEGVFGWKMSNQDVHSCGGHNVYENVDTAGSMQVFCTPALEDISSSTPADKGVDIGILVDTGDIWEAVMILKVVHDSPLDNATHPHIVLR